MQDYQFHRYASIWPLPNEQSPAFLALCDSMLEHGNRVPIILYQDQILDGRTRYLVAKQHPTIELKFELFTGTDAEALSLALALNNERRNLNESQRALAAFNYARYSIEVHNLKADKADVEACKKFRATLKTVNRIAKVIKTEHDQPEAKYLLEGIAAGDLTVTKAVAIIGTLPAAVWRNVANDEEKATKAIKEGKAREKELNQERDFANGIHSDNRGDFSGNAETVYGVIYTDYASGVDLPGADSCAVFMWALPDQVYSAIDRLLAAGFLNGTVYNFIRLANGKMVKAQVEHLICAVKGDPPMPTFQQNMVLNLPSGIPPQYADIIGEFYKVPKLAMFAEQVKHQGDDWTYEPTLTEKPKPKRAATKKVKGKAQVTESAETVDG